MKDIRQGNDISLQWTVNNLSQVSGDKVVQLINCDSKHAAKVIFAISGDIINGVYYGKDQHEKGEYRLILYVNRDFEGMVTLDKVGAFRLHGVCDWGIVKGTDEDNVQTVAVELESTLEVNTGAGGAQVQSDWNETDTDDPAYIKNKPTIPSEVTESTVAGWGFTKNTGDYSKPSGGIPSTDLSSAVQTSLGKADTALQSETDPTVPAWAKQSSKPSYTASEVGAVPTTRKVNGKALSSDVTLDASDVGALPSSTPIPVVPTNVSAFTNDAGYLTQHQDISGKEDKVDIVPASGTTLTAEVGKYYTLSNIGTLAITLPTIAAGTTKVQTVTFYIAAGSSPAVTFTSSHSIYYSDGFEIAASSTYEVSAAYNGIAWVVASVKIVIPT